MTATITPSERTYLADVAWGSVTLQTGGYRQRKVRLVALDRPRHDRFGIIRERALRDAR